jgi:hypothetical protein
MRFYRWLLDLAGVRERHKPSRTARRPARYRPRLEVLEDRWLPSTLTVTTTADSGPGSLRAEIAAAQSGDTINFAPALFGQTIALTSGQLVIDKSLTIEGPGTNNAPVTISGGGAGFSPTGSSRVFDITNSSSTVVLDNLDIAGGRAPIGGGILDQGANLTLEGCTVAINFATGSVGGDAIGGGLYSTGGNLTISGCTFLNNAAFANSFSSLNNGVNALGGDMYIAGGTVSITNSDLGGGSLVFTKFSGGNALGGSIYLAAGTLSTTNCNISEADAIASADTGNVFTGLAAGFGIYQAGGTVLVTNTTFFSDQDSSEFSGHSLAGVAIYSASGDLTVKNSTFSNDGGLAAFLASGGAIYKSSGNLSLQNTVFEDCGVGSNSNTSFGGAVDLVGGTATVANCQFFSNAAFDGGALYVSGGTLAISNCGFAGNSAMDVGNAIDIVGGSVSISKNTFTGSSPLGAMDVVGPYTLS